MREVFGLMKNALSLKKKNQTNEIKNKKTRILILIKKFYFKVNIKFFLII